MKTKSCKYEDNCRYHHPKKIRNVNQNQPDIQFSQKSTEDQSYAQNATKNLHPKGDFLGSF